MMPKKLLIISSYRLFPAKTGGAYYTLAYIEKQMHDFDISIIITPESILESDMEAFQKQFFKVKLIRAGAPLAGFKKIKKRIVKLIRKISGRNWPLKLRKIPKVAEMFSKDTELIKEIERIANAEDYHIIQVEHIINLPLVSLFPKKSLKVFVEYDIFFTGAMKDMKQLHYGVSYSKYINEIIKGAEVYCLNQYDGIITLTEQDRDTLADAGVTTSIRASHCIAIKNDELKKTFSPSIQPHILFLGSEDHLPNADGLTWFLQKVYPTVVENHTEARLLVTGNWSNEFKEKYKHLPIHFTGFVDSVEPLLNSGILIVPIHIGGGIRIKVIEAMTKGSPIVATVVGASGIPYIQNEENMCISDDPTQFAAYLLELLESEKKRKQFSDNIFATTVKIREHGDFAAERNADYEEFEKIRLLKNESQL